MALKPNEIKIMNALQEIKQTVCTSDLAELANIHVKSIGRYIKTLVEKGLVKVIIQQVHAVRMRMVCLTEKGGNTEYIQEIAILKEPEVIEKKPTKKKLVKKNADRNQYNKTISIMIDEYEQLKCYFRAGNRPAQNLAIANFEKHLKELL